MQFALGFGLAVCNATADSRASLLSVQPMSLVCGRVFDTLEFFLGELLDFVKSNALSLLSTTS